MGEALIERGIGATRALVIEGGAVVEAHFERDDTGPRAGALWVGRLVTRLERRGIVRLGEHEGVVEPLPAGTEGSLVRVEVVREALHEAGRPRAMKLRGMEGEAAAEGEVRAGADLGARLRAAGHRVVMLEGPGEDGLEVAGWSEVVETARTGLVPFAGGVLTVSPTPAMVVIDIDGPGAVGALAESAAVAVGQVVRRFDLQGSLGVDFPSVEGKAARVRLGELLDAGLPGPYERTAVNGFGFVQVVRPRLRASFMESVRAPGFAALELLRRAGRGAAGGRTLVAHPGVVAWLEARGALLAALGQATGGAVRLRADGGLAISGGYVE